MLKNKTMKTNKNFRMVQGILLHPFKSVFFYLSGGSRQYDILSIRAKFNADNKAFTRKMYFSSLTGTDINL